MHPLPWILVWLFSIFLGSVIGGQKKRRASGIIWPLLMGPIGLVVVILLPNIRETQCKRCGTVNPLRTASNQPVKFCSTCGEPLYSAEKSKNLRNALAVSLIFAPLLSWTCPSEAELRTAFNAEVCKKDPYLNKLFSLAIGSRQRVESMYDFDKLKKKSPFFAAAIKEAIGSEMLGDQIFTKSFNLTYHNWIAFSFFSNDEDPNSEILVIGAFGQTWVNGLNF